MLFRSAKAHDVFHSSAVVPASVEDDNFPGGGKVPHVTLHVHLALFAVGWSGQRHETENARADPFRDRTNGSAFPSGVPTFKYDNDAQTLVLNPILKLAELFLKPAELLLIIFPLQTTVAIAVFLISHRGSLLAD